VSRAAQRKLAKLQILAACGEAGKPVGMMPLTAEAARPLTARGVRAIVQGVESHRIKDFMTSSLRPATG